MALTIGSGPFSKSPAGSFDVHPPSRPLLFWEPFPKRLRVMSGGETFVDSDRVLAVHETGEMMRLCVPQEDVRRERLSPGREKDGGRLGRLTAWSLGRQEEGSDAAAWSIDAPPAAAAALKGYVIPDLATADAWRLEDDLGYAHPRDPYHRVDVQRSSRHVLVRAGDAVVAESSAPAILFETGLPPRVYLAPDAVRPGLLARSSTVSQCPYKGDGQHWHVVVGGERIADAAWNLTTPMGDALLIPRWFSFYPGKVEVEVDGRALKA